MMVVVVAVDAVVVVVVVVMVAVSVVGRCRCCRLFLFAGCLGGFGKRRLVVGRYLVALVEEALPNRFGRFPNPFSIDSDSVVVILGMKPKAPVAVFLIKAVCLCGQNVSAASAIPGNEGWVTVTAARRRRLK